MSNSVCISVDAMGGDQAPRMVVEGLAIVRERMPDIRFLLFGREGDVGPLLDRYPKVRAVTELRHAETVVGAGDKPSTALRRGRESSMRQAIDAVASGEAQGAVSAGNTGALMAMAKAGLRTLPGIHRPAIASLFPNRRGSSVMLDLGANVDCSADMLVQFAIMGEVFARRVLRLDRPRVALLSIGEEDLKGNQVVKEAAAILQDSELAFQFAGFVEGDDIGLGKVDVIVTDGFTGNVAVKTMEGTARLYTHIIEQALTGSWMARIGTLLVRPALRRVGRRVDPRYYNGAMFLGLNGICVKSHGSADGLGFANAVEVTVKLVADRVIDGIKEDFAEHSTAHPEGDRLVSGA